MRALVCAVAYFSFSMCVFAQAQKQPAPPDLPETTATNFLNPRLAEKPQPRNMTYKGKSIMAFTEAEVPVEAVGDPQAYAYHENSALGLGKGFDPRDVSQYKRGCIKGQQVAIDTGPVDTNLRVIYVRDRNQLNFSMNYDSKADAAFLTAKGSARFSVDTSGAFDSDAITVVMTGKTDFGRWGLDADADLTEDAKKLLSDGKKFAEICGTRYVAAERRGASVSAVITISRVSSEFKTEFVSEFAGKGGWGDLSASAKSKLTLALRYARYQSRANVQVFATGGGGLSSLKEGLEKIPLDEKDPLSKTFEALGGFLNGFTAANAAPIRYYVASMKQFGWDEYSVDPWTDAREESLRTLVQWYRNASLEVELYQQLHDTSSLLYRYLGSERATIELKDEEEAKLLKFADAKAHATCKQETRLVACSMPAYGAIGFYNIVAELGPPKMLFQCLTNPGAIFTDEQKTRLILSTARNVRFEFVKGLMPGAEFVQCSFSIDLAMLGDEYKNIVASRQGFDYATGGEDWVHDWRAGGGGMYFWYLWPIYNNPPGFENTIIEWFGKHRGDFSGTYFIEFEDRLNRRFRLPFYTAAWHGTGGGLTKFEWEVLQ